MRVQKEMMRCLLAGLVMVFLAGSVFAETAQDLYRIGKGAFDDGFYDLSRRNLKRLVSEYPDSELADRAQYHIGLGFFRQENYTAAVFEMQTLLQQYPDSGYRLAAGYYIAVSEQKNGRVLESVVLLEKLVAGQKNDPVLPHAWFALGEGCMLLKRYDRAGEAFSHILKTWSIHELVPFARMQYGLSLFRLRDYRGSAREFSLVINTGGRPELVPQAEYWLGESRYWLEEYAEARQRFANILSKWPQSEYAGDSKYRIAFSWLRQDEFETARTNFREFVAGWPKHAMIPEALLKLGWLAQRGGEYDVASKYYENVIKNFPESGQILAEAAFNAALCHYKLGNNERAAGLFSDVAKLQSTEEQRILALKSRGDVALVMGKPDLARQAYEEFIKTWPANELAEEVWYWLGTAYMRTRMFRKPGSRF